MWGQQSAEQITSLSSLASVSPIWSSHIRDVATSSKMSSAELADIRSQNLVPGFMSEEFEHSVGQCSSNVSHDTSQLRSCIPILLIQRPGSQDPVRKRIGKTFLWIWFIILSSIGPVKTCYGYYKADWFCRVSTRSCSYAYHDPMWGIRGTAPLTLNLGARWSWVVSFTCWLIYFWYPLSRRLGRPQVSLGNLEKRNSLVTPGTVLWFIQHVAWSLYRLSCLSCILNCCVLFKY